MDAQTDRSPARPILITVGLLFCVGSIAVALAYPLNWSWVGPALGAVGVAAFRYFRR
ncbi:hypothetical protein [Streptomyces sp. 846.5]|jgi:hypothetical protein|uniref:hypothetical protein n=1 Tax=Streptacidiphilus sp. EB103A TaxID=3156275 RepID=UPI0010E2F11B|nr:hypothetical protein [Streptomyces sp. 846.5]TDT97711.1 hypothetical protein EDD99_5901 [Streptomyces sp. 846.5]